MSADDSRSQSSSATGVRPALGFIGLGIMGSPLVGHLLRAGFPVSVYSRTRSKAAAAIESGAIWCDSPAAVAQRCEILLTMVTDTPDVQAVLFGENGAAEALVDGAIVVDLSTISPEATRDFAKRLETRGILMLDAPVTGGDIGAKNATLTIMVGGNETALSRARPILETIGKRIVHVGPSGSGQTLKACNQILCGVNLVGVCEALLLAEKSGIDANLLIETLGAGAGGSWALANYGPRIARGDYQPGFMIKLQQKDLRIVQDAAQMSGVPLPGASLAQQLFRAVEATAGGGELGTQAMMQAYRRLGGSA